MTYYPSHPPIYYSVRTAVRILFWGAIGTATIYLLFLFSFFGNDYDPCPIEFAPNFTYTTTEWYPSMDCDIPSNIDMDLRGNWWWAS